MLPTLATAGAWFADHGYSLVAGFVGGLLAVIVHDRWRIVRRQPDDEGKD